MLDYMFSDWILQVTQWSHMDKGSEFLCYQDLNHKMFIKWIICCKLL